MLLAGEPDPDSSLVPLLSLVLWSPFPSFSPSVPFVKRLEGVCTAALADFLSQWFLGCDGLRGEALGAALGRSNPGLQSRLPVQYRVSCFQLRSCDGTRLARSLGRTAMIATSITKLQTAVRCWLWRKRFLRERAAAVTVQAWMRGERTRATVGREMAELVRKRKEKEAQEAEALRVAEEERQKELEEQAVSARLGQVCGSGGLWPSFFRRFSCPFRGFGYSAPSVLRCRLARFLPRALVCVDFHIRRAATRPC